MTQKNIPACADGRSPLKRVAAIHDLSCFGRCALTVIMPTLSAMGNQVIPVPTCLLSSHTGGFDDLYFEDLTDPMKEIGAHFDRLDLKFDAIYTGFLGSSDQIEIVRAFIDRFSSKDTVILVDPVMGDGGELYSTYTPRLMEGMAHLCHKAKVITPNLTEACFLTGTEYRDTAGMCPEDVQSYVRELCRKLSVFGTDKTVITGIHSGEGRLAVCGQDNVSGEFFSYEFERVKRDYPGTGDLFACVLLGRLMDGARFEDCVVSAADFVSRAMEYSAKFSTPEREGVAFEALLSELIPHSH